MPKDLFTLKKTESEYFKLFTGAKINKITEPSKDELVFTLYNKKTFNAVISTRAKYARLSLTTQNYVNPLVAPNFCMLLRKYLTGGTITNLYVSKIDRIITLEILNENDFKEFKTYSLHVEIMGKYSNVFLTSNGILLGALKNSTQNLEKGRITLAGAKYLFPLKQDKTLIQDKETALKLLSGITYPITGNFILNNFLGLAPVTAEEIAYLVNLDAEKRGYSAENAYEVILNFTNTPLAPVIISSNEYTDLFVFDYKHLNGNREYFSNFLVAEEAFYTKIETYDKLEQQKSSLLSKIHTFKKKEDKKFALLKSRETEALSYKKFRVFGELITANIYKIKKGATQVELINYFNENCETIKVNLDKDLSPQENAQRYFKKYSKLKTALTIAKEQLLEVESELKYVGALEYSIKTSETILELNEIESELKLQGFIKNTESNKPKSKKPLSFNFTTYLIDGFTVKVGKNNLQNEALLLEANRNDLWLHVKDYHSSFVIIKSENKTVPDSVILASAEICAYRSEAKNGSKIAVDYTLRKFVKKPPKSRPGSVIYTDYETIIVNPNSHDEYII
ncbi:MAG: NFACT family protein [Clostridia bacterium]|nr:NFACT family protein [Clostridia bacterium]